MVLKHQKCMHHSFRLKRKLKTVAEEKSSKVFFFKNECMKIF